MTARPRKTGDRVRHVVPRGLVACVVVATALAAGCAEAPEPPPPGSQIGPVFDERGFFAAPPPACGGAHLDDQRIGVMTGTLTEGRMTLDDGPVLARGAEVDAVHGLAETAQGLVVGGRDGFWLLRDGAAHFIDAQADGDVEGFFVTDLDADGADDLAVQSDNGSALVTIWRNGDDGFERGSAFKTGSNVDLFALGDVDGDGASDLAAFTGGELLVQRNDRALGFEQTLGDGTFLPSPFTNSTPAGGALLDVNADSRVDAVAVYTVEIDGVTRLFAQVFNGDGAGRFAANTRTILRSPWNGTVRGASFGDVTGDGFPDAVISAQESNGMNTVYVAQGLGFGGFGELRSVFSDQQAISTRLIDPDGDGTSDVACLHSAGPGFATLTVLRSLGSTEQEAEPHAIPVGDVRAFAARADGTFDLLVALGCELPCDEQCDGRCVLDACMSCVDDRDCSEGVCGGSLHTCRSDGSSGSTRD